MKKKIRHTLIRLGVVAPASLQESREVFTFPYAPHEQPKIAIGMTRHIEKLFLRKYQR